MILVTAASGRTGQSVVRALASSGQPVRAFDLSERVKELHRPGVVEAVVGDMLDSRALDSALEGVTAVVHIGPPMHPREAQIGHAVVSAARRAGVAHFVQFSVTHPQLEPLLNHQAKLAVERVVLTSRMPFTILQPMHYMQNVDVPRVVADGVLRQPYALDTPLAHVDLEDVAEVAAQVTADPARHHYATYELCADAFHDAHQLAAIISAAAWQAVTAEQHPLPAAAAGPNPSEAEDYRLDAMHRLFDHYGRYGITGNPNVLGWLLGRPPTTFAEYARRCLNAPPH